MQDIPLLHHKRKHSLCLFLPVPDRKMQYKAVEIKFEADDTLEIFFAKVHTTSQYISKVVECLKKFDNVFHLYLMRELTNC